MSESETHLCKLLEKIKKADTPEVSDVFRVPGKLPDTKEMHFKIQEALCVTRETLSGAQETLHGYPGEVTGTQERSLAPRKGD